MAIHLTPTELGREAGMHRREVITKCMELGVPIFQGRIDKTLFTQSLKQAQRAARAGEGVAPRSRPSLESACQAEPGGGADGSSDGPGFGHGLEDDGGPGGAGRRRSTATSPALRHKVGDEWVDVSYAELGDGGQRDRPRADRPRPRARRQGRDRGPHPARVDLRPLRHPRRRRRLGLGLPDQLRRGVPLRAGALRVEGRVPRGRRAAGEDPRGARPAAQPRAHRPVRPVEGADDAITLDELRERGRGRDAAELEARTAAVTKDDICIYIYTSGTTGPPKGCILSHGNYRDVISMSESQGVLQEDEVVYLFLPLAHAFAKLIQFVALDLGGMLAYWEKDPQKIIPNLMETKPTYFPSVPRMFEKIYTLATSNAEDPEKLQQAVQVGLKVRQMQQAGQEVPGRAAGRLRPGRGGALQERARHLRRQHPPVQHGRRADRQGDPRVLLRLRRAGDGGLRHDRDLHGGHGQHARGVPPRLGGQADPRRGGQGGRGRRAAAARRRTSSRATTRTRRPRARRWSTAGCTPATSARSTTTASSSSSAARRTSSSPRAARTSRRPTWRTASSRTAGSPRRWWSATAGPTWSR